MFEKELEGKFQRIFDFKKTSFREPSVDQEQEHLFIKIESAKNAVRDKKFVGIAKGKIHVFASSDKLPYGYFTKQLAKSKAADLQGLFFFDFEENSGTIDNIVERTCSFIYFFDIQYDPDLGLMDGFDSTVGLQ